MKKTIIPRRDHEVYFIPVPKALRPKPMRSFVMEQMEKLHPGFSGDMALDIKRLVFNKSRWVMATVMEAETLAEYKVLYKGSAFLTNTSIAVQKKGFVRDGVKTVGDELIGYDSGNDSPVSIPLEPNSRGSQPGAAKSFTRKGRVFTGRIPAWRVTTVIVCAGLTVLIPLFFFPAAKEAEEKAIVPFAATTATMPSATMPSAIMPSAIMPLAESATELEYLPTAMEILADFSADLAGTNGKITRWQYNEGRYNENFAPLVTIETRGIDVLSLHGIFNQFKYIVLEDIVDVRYIDGEPYLTAFLSAVRKGYLAPGTGTFFSQSFSLPIFSDLTSELRRHDVSIVSETLPSTENGNALYSVTYTAKDKALIRSMEILAAICDKYPVRVKGMDISIAGESSRFTVVCSLSQSDAPRYAAMGDEKGQTPPDNIPLAFGYREDPPPEKIAETDAEEPQAAPQTQETRPEVSIVGTIKDDKGQILFYREAGDSKIKLKDTP